MQESAKSSMFQEYIFDTNYEPCWRRLNFQDDLEKPSMRGGHQMTIDVKVSINFYIFLFILRVAVFICLVDGMVHEI